MGMTLFLVLCAFLLGISIGWYNAHFTVATECERLGKFYVGKKVYNCYMIEGESQE